MTASRSRYLCRKARPNRPRPSTGTRCSPLPWISAAGFTNATMRSRWYVMEAEEPEPGDRDEPERDHRRQVLLRDAGHEDHAEPDARHDDGCAEVRLEQHEEDRRRDIEPRDDDVTEIADRCVAPREVFGEQRDEHELRRVRRLERDRAEREPCLSAHDRVRRDEQQREQRERDAIAGQDDRRAAQEAQVDRYEIAKYTTTPMASQTTWRGASDAPSPYVCIVTMPSSDSATPMATSGHSASSAADSPGPRRGSRERDDRHDVRRARPARRTARSR